METIIRKALRKPTAASTVYLVKNKSDLDKIFLNPKEKEYVKRRHREQNNTIELNRYKNNIFVVFGDFQGTRAIRMENYRKNGDKVQEIANKNKIEKIVIYPVNAETDETLAFAEGLILGNYRFLKYKSKNTETKHTLEEISIYDNRIGEEHIEELRIVAESVYNARDLVNEPVSYLTATVFAEEIKNLLKNTGAKVEIFNKRKIESLKMGGLLAVNKGSIEPPTFTIIEWKPENAINNKPLVFVGKGVVYDTGGLSLKPTNFMDTMKSDMAGAAAVATSLYAIAKAQLPYHVIGLIPATDNRPDGNAYAPGDIVTMYDGSTVEVLNTDAEGRMILADALSYAKKYEPELVIDIATLTGAAARAIGPQAIVGMKAKAEEDFTLLKKSGDKVHERIVEFPFWDEYKEQLKSNVADLKNIGGVNAGAITAGKFLEHFTGYPYIHLDIAAPSFLEKRDSYRGKGGTGVGTRLFYQFVKDKISK
jgi:leucyl aminopeptidase